MVVLFLTAFSCMMLIFAEWEKDYMKAHENEGINESNNSNL